MDRDGALGRALEALDDATSHQDLSTAIHMLRDDYGLTNITYRGFRLVGIDKIQTTMIISTSDPEWFLQYDARELSRIDPIVDRARNSPLPLDWDDIDRRSKSARHYFSEMMRFKIGDRGLSMTISPPNRPPGLFTFIASELSGSEWQSLRRRCQADMMFLGQHVHYHAQTIGQIRQADDLLTERGRRCLELVLNGHKPGSIAKLLGLSIHTVRMHLRHMQKRLDCHTLPEAIGRAMELGILKNAHAVPAARSPSYGIGLLGR
jgi:DNA-binding CsgD family transcriptional regulator